MASPSEQLRIALAAYDPIRPRWQQQRQYQELQKATEALAAKIAETQGKLDRRWDWLEAHRDDPEHQTREEVWMALNEKYEAAYRLYQEAAAVSGEAG